MEYSTINVGPANLPVYYYRAGSGEPLLYLHHLMGHAGFEPVLAKLSESFDVIAPVAPGWGPAKDDLPQFDPGALDLVLHQVDVLDAFAIDSAHVFGTSIGGWMAAEVAAVMPQRVRNLVLASPFGLWLDEVGGEDPFAQHPGFPSTILFSDSAMRQQFFFDGRDKLDAHVEELLNLRAGAKFLWPIPDTGIAKRLPRIKAPTLVISGSADVVVPPAYGAAWCEAIENAKFASVEGGGHLVALECADVVADLVSKFLSSQSIAAVA